MLDVRDGENFDHCPSRGPIPDIVPFFPIGNEMAKEQEIRSAGPIRVGIRNEVKGLESLRIRKGIPEIASEWTRDINRAWQEYRASILKRSSIKCFNLPCDPSGGTVLFFLHGKTAVREKLQVSLRKTESIWPEPVTNLQPDEWAVIGVLFWPRIARKLKCPPCFLNR